MKTVDPGHFYFLQNYSVKQDGTIPLIEEQSLYFMYRIGDQGRSYDGTNCQEVLRALIDRSIYLQNQIPCDETRNIIINLRSALYWFEKRAAREHGLQLPPSSKEIEQRSTCKICGHIICRHKHTEVDLK